MTAEPTADHHHCPCVERLRAQNKASSDEWTKRTAQQTSELAGLKHLMEEAYRYHRKGKNIGISAYGQAYGQAALAEALRLADDAEAELEVIRAQWLIERRARLVAEDRLAKIREADQLKGAPG